MRQLHVDPTLAIGLTPGQSSNASINKQLKLTLKSTRFKRTLNRYQSFFNPLFQEVNKPQLTGINRDGKPEFHRNGLPRRRKTRPLLTKHSSPAALHHSKPTRLH